MNKEEIIKQYGKKEYKIIEPLGLEEAVVFQSSVKEIDGGKITYILAFRIGAITEDINFFCYRPVIAMDGKNIETEFDIQLESLRQIFNNSKGLKDKWKKNQK